MPINPADLTDYAWSDIAKAAKASMMSSAVGGAEYRMPDGRMLRRMTIDEATALYETATAMANAEANAASGGGNVLVRRGVPR